MSGLATKATLCGGISPETLIRYLTVAFSTNAVTTSARPQQRGFDVPDLVDMNVNDSKIDIGQQIGHRLFLRIVHLPGDLNIALTVRPQQFLTNLRTQFLQSLLQLLRERPSLAR